MNEGTDYRQTCYSRTQTNEQRTDKQQSSGPAPPSSFGNALRNVQVTAKNIHIASRAHIQKIGLIRFRKRQTYLGNHWNQTGRGHDTRMFALPIGFDQDTPSYMEHRDEFMFLLIYDPNVLTVKF